MSSKQRILIVDDEPDILEFLGFNLEMEGYEVQRANNGAEGLEKAKGFLPDLVLMDVMMPVMDGIEACIEIRKNPATSKAIICFLTARAEDYSQIAGLEAGADDYITKPIKPRVLLSKIKSLLRRADGVEEGISPNSIELHGLIIDKEQHLIFKGGEAFHLPKKQFEILLLLSSKPGKVFNRDVMMSQVWGDDIIVGDRNIDVQIRKLREKIGEDYIRTIKGVGYKFVNPEADPLI
jgi:two-component system alkaline phosphatase synthesis response regulator PhoP